MHLGSSPTPRTSSNAPPIYFSISLVFLVLLMAFLHKCTFLKTWRRIPICTKTSIQIFMTRSMAMSMMNSSKKLHMHQRWNTRWTTPYKRTLTQQSNVQTEQQDTKNAYDTQEKIQQPPFFSLAAMPRGAKTLGIAGLIPFVAGTAVALSEKAGPEAIWLAADMMSEYGAVILAFVGGAQWGMAVHDAKNVEATPTLPWIHRPSTRFGIAVMPSIVAFFTLPIVDVGTRLVIQMIGFNALLVYELSSVKYGAIPHWYGRLRTFLTILTSICMGTTTYALLQMEDTLTIMAAKRDAIERVLAEAFSG